MESIIKDRVHAVYYTDPGEIPHIRDYYLKHPDKAEEIATNARALVVSQFSTAATVRRIVSSLKREGILDESCDVGGRNDYA